MSVHSRMVPLILSLLLVVGCASSRAGGGSGGGDRNVLTPEQLRSTGAQDAFGAVQALRANWLQARGPDSFSSPSEVLVYVDDVRLGGVDNLRSITLPQIGYIQYYDGRAAAGRWGLDHGQGVIFVSTRTDRD